MRPNGFVIIASDSEMRIWAYGTPQGRPFATEAAADRRRKQMERMTVGLHFMVVPLHTMIAGSMLRSAVA